MGNTAYYHRHPSGGFCVLLPVQHKAVDVLKNFSIWKNRAPKGWVEFEFHVEMCDRDEDLFVYWLQQTLNCIAHHFKVLHYNNFVEVNSIKKFGTVFTTERANQNVPKKFINQCLCFDMVGRQWFFEHTSGAYIATSKVGNNVSYLWMDDKEEAFLVLLNEMLEDLEEKNIISFQKEPFPYNHLTSVTHVWNGYTWKMDIKSNSVDIFF